MRNKLTEGEAIKFILSDFPVYYFDEYKRDFFKINSLYEISELIMKNENEIEVTFWGKNYER